MRAVGNLRQRQATEAARMLIEAASGAEERLPVSPAHADLFDLNSTPLDDPIEV